MKMLKTLALTALIVPAMAACTMDGNTHHKPSSPPSATYSARCMGNDYNGCYEDAADKCRGTAGYRVFAKKNNVIGKEIMYSCIFK